MQSAGRPFTVTYQDVEQACLKLLAQGENISFGRVYTVLGSRGGGKTVASFIKQFKQTAATQLLGAAQPPIPEGVADPRLVRTIQDALCAAVTVAEENLAAGYAAKEKELADTRAAVELQAAQAAEATAAAVARVAEVEAELSVARAEIAGRDARLGDLKETLEAEISRRAKADARIAHLQDELSGQAQRHEEQIAHLQGELAGERERAAGERKLLTAQTDALRQDKARELAEQESTIKSLREEIKRRESAKDKEIEHGRGQLDKCRHDLSEALAALRVAQAEASDARAAHDVTRVELQRLQSLVAANAKRSDTPKRVRPSSPETSGPKKKRG